MLMLRTVFIAAIFYYFVVSHIGFAYIRDSYNDDFGNELQSAEVLFSYSSKSKSKFNDTDYFLDSNSCRGQIKYYMCVKLVNQYHRNIFRLWHPADHSLQRKLDCKYRLHFKKGELVNEYYVFRFIIYQSDCINNIPGLIGGTTFSLFASSVYFLIGCSSIDNFNGTYNINCKFPAFNEDFFHYNILTETDDNIAFKTERSNSSNFGQGGSSKFGQGGSGTNCIKLTVLVEYEHFDGYSESIIDWSGKYPPSKNLVVNHMQFCMP